MSTRTLAVVSAGLSVSRRRPGCWPTGSPPRPSSALRDRGVDADRRGRRAARARPRPGRQPAHRLREHEPARGARHRDRRRRPDRRHADLLRLLQRPVQDVLRRRRQGRADGQARAARRDRRHGPALARPRPRAAAAVRLPARGRRADRRLRGGGGLGQQGTRRTATSSGASSAPPASSPTSSRSDRRPPRPTRSRARCRSKRCCAAPDPIRPERTLRWPSPTPRPAKPSAPASATPTSSPSTSGRSRPHAGCTTPR